MKTIKVDSHVHLVTAKMLMQVSSRFSKIKSNILERAESMGRKFVNPDFVEFLNNTSIPDFARLWERELDKNNIDHALFLPISGGSNEQLDEFVSINPERFSAYVFLENPKSRSGVKKFEKLIKTGSFVGIKLYPSIQNFSVADKALFPLYEKAAELATPLLIHFGITHAPLSDYRFTNPLDLQLPSKMFPETNFIIANFGAGFFRELLLLGFHSENIYVDTSGTNNWRKYQPKVMPLKDVFKRTLEVYGPSKVLYGTDTIINDASRYRQFVLREQTKVMRDLKLPKKDRDLIMGRNAFDLFGLHDRMIFN